ncbi:hypothetical protein [Mycoplasmopsis pullorum]|nr:hypothetical protein [Mycoplasmopsis pullorum]
MSVPRDSYHILDLSTFGSVAFLESSPGDTLSFYRLLWIFGVHAAQSPRR